MSHNGISDRDRAHLDSGERQRASTHRLALLIGGVIPVALALAATVLMVTWLPQLPNPIAVHWSGVAADGFGPALPFVLTPLVIVALFSILAVAMSWRTVPTGGLLYNQKILLTTGVWLSTLLSFGFTGSVFAQRGLADVAEAPNAGPVLLTGAAVGLALATAAWFLLPKGSSSIIEVGQQPKAVDLRGDERLSWSHTARLGNIGLLIVGVAFVVAGGVTIFATVASQRSTVLALAILAFLAVLVVTNTWWRVSADRRGFTVRGAAGWPSKHIPLEGIRTVQVVEVTPTRDFGGYGWRWTVDGRSGVILRAGVGIEVTASSGKRFVVTVDDADTGAGVIAALLTQQVSRSA